MKYLFPLQSAMPTFLNSFISCSDTAGTLTKVHGYLYSIDNMSTFFTAGGKYVEGPAGVQGVLNCLKTLNLSKS